MYTLVRLFVLSEFDAVQYAYTWQDYLTVTGAIARFSQYLLMTWWRKLSGISSRNIDLVPRSISASVLLRPKTGCCPMTGHRLAQGWPPHIGRPISVRRPSDDRSPYSTNFRPKTVRSDQSGLISGRRLTAVKIACEKKTFRNLNKVVCKRWFCGYRWLLLHKDFSITVNYRWNNWKLPSNRQWTQWGCNTLPTRAIAWQ